MKAGILKKWGVISRCTPSPIIQRERPEKNARWLSREMASKWFEMVKSNNGETLGGGIAEPKKKKKRSDNIEIVGILRGSVPTRPRLPGGLWGVDKDCRAVRKGNHLRSKGGE